MNQLSDEEFHATFAEPMNNVTETVEELVDVWPYIDNVLLSEYAEADTDSWDVEYVYINGSNSYQHILINTGMINVYLVVIVDVIKKTIYGHHLLNLNQKYGLTH